MKLPDGTTIQGYWDGGTSADGTVYPDGKTDGGVQGGLSVAIPFDGDPHAHGASHADAPSSATDDGTGGTYEPATPGTYEHPSGYCISDAGDQYRSGEIATFGDGNQYQCFEGSWIPLADPNVQPAGDDDASSDAYAASSDDGSDQSDDDTAWG